MTITTTITEMLHLIATHEKTSTGSLLRLAALPGITDTLGRAILTHRACSTEVIEQLLDNLLSPTTAVEHLAEEAPATDEAPVEKEPVLDVSEEVDVDADAPMEGDTTVASVITMDAKVKEQMVLARKTKSSAVLRDLLTTSPSTLVWDTALRNRFVGIREMRDYFATEGSALREAVVSNTRCPQDILLAGVNDASAKVRRAAVQHPKAGAEVLLAAAQGHDTDLHYFAVRHPNTTHEALSVLAELEDEGVAPVAAERLTKVTA